MQADLFEVSTPLRSFFLAFFLPSLQASSGVTPGVDISRQLLLRVEFLVLFRCPPFGHETGDDGQAAAGDDHTATCLVSWLLGAEEEVRCEPVGDL